MSKKIKNKIMLITYADSLGKNLKELTYVLDTWYKECVGGIHILPFFPSSGDRGFAPDRYDMVVPEFGTWNIIEELSKKYYLMFDFMINHISPNSPYFQDYLKNHNESKWKDMFLKVNTVWKDHGPDQDDIDRIYKRKDKAPFETVQFADGTTEKLWCTFSTKQIDLDVQSDTTKKFIKETLSELIKKGASIIRLDAFAYCIKKAGTNCFFVKPDILNYLKDIQKTVSEQGTMILPEIHEHYSMQMELAEQNFWVYDFALPMLVLHTLYTGSGQRLKDWLAKCPRKQFTTLDTHDGIGIVDVKDLLTDSEIENTVAALYKTGANVKRKYSSAEYNNLDIYQINCTFYSALGNNDKKYLLARAIQFFAPGIPQVYYVGLLAGQNDIDLLEKTKNGRDINRHYYTVEEIEKNQSRPLIICLNTLMKFRNTNPAFDGTCKIMPGDDNHIIIRRQNNNNFAELTADLCTAQFTITYSDGTKTAEILDCTL